MKSSRRRYRTVADWAPVASLMACLVLPAVAQFPGGPPQNLPAIPERRAQVLKEFDADGDGRLSDAEREIARKAWARHQLSRRQDRGMFRPPPEFLEEFDKDKDGELDDAEGQVAREVMGKRFEKMTKDYDKNGNSRLDEDEIAAASKDIDDGKLKGIPKMFLQFARGGPRGGKRGPGEVRGPAGPGAGVATANETDADPADLVRNADRDGDGRLNAAELEAARAAWAKRKAAKAKQGGGR